MSASATPAMRQYLDAKQQHRDAILFFRMGDFYEMFYEDALVAARALELTLTSRSKDANGGGIPMCGVPFHAVDGYIARLVKKGFRVAICEQVEDPRKAKGIVKREVVRVVSPGTLTDAELSRRARAGVPDGDRAGARARRPHVDRRGAARSVDRRVHRRRVRRRRRPAGAGRRARRAAAARDRRARPTAAHRPQRSRRSPRCGLPITPIDGWTLRAEAARRDAARSAAAPAASKASASTATRRRSRPPARWSHYLRDTQKADLAHVRAIAYRQRADALLIDPTTLKHLEIVEGVGGRPRGLAARRARSHGHVDGQPAAARRGCCGRSSRSSRSAIGSTPSRSSRSARPSAASSARRSRPCRTSSGWSRAPRSAPPARAIWSALQAVAGRRSRALRTVLAELQAPLVAVAARRARRPRRRPRRDRARRSIDEPPALARDGGFTRDGVDAELDELRAHQPLGQAGHRRDGRARARAHRHRVAEGPLQPRVRLLHRDLEVEPARRAGRLPPQADDRRRRAVHHAGAEGVRGEGARRRRADPRARARALRARCARASPPRRRASRRRRARWRRSTCWPRSPRPRRSTTTSSRTSTTATS